MSKEAVQHLIDRAIKDETFAKLLADKPDQAVQDYDLTPEEISAFHSLQGEEGGQFAMLLDRRMVKTDGDAKVDGDQSADVGDGDADVDDAQGDDWWIGSVTD